jgi:DNA polymerase-3 subunit gamma/tau
MQGDIAAALAVIRELYDAGADPQTIIADLCDLTHLVTRIKIVPAAADDVSLTPDERTRGGELAQKLAMRALTRSWQILFKGYDEVASAGNALQAAEMVLIRLAHAADLPTPDELIAKLANQPVAQPSALTAPVARNGGGPQAMRQMAPDPAPRPNFEPAPAPQSAPRAAAMPQDYAELIALAGEKRDLIVKRALEASLRPIAFTEGRLEVALTEGADPGIIQTLSARLKAWTGRNWMVTVSAGAPAGPTIKELAEARAAAELNAAHEDPLVQAILETFPGARVANVKLRDEAPAMSELPPLAEDEEDDE